MANLVDLHKLQEDILATCIAGKPLIEEASIASMRIPFKFKEDISSLSLHLRYVQQHDKHHKYGHIVSKCSLCVSS